MTQVLFVLAHDNPEASREAREALQARGAIITQSYGTGVLIADADAELALTLTSHPGVVGVYIDAVPAEACQNLDETGRLGVAGWNQRHHDEFHAAKRQRKGEGKSWGDPEYEPEG
jgi:hypothetical protein